MDRAACAALVLLIGCAQPDFVTDREVSVYLQGNEGALTKAQADDLDRWVVEKADQLFSRCEINHCMAQVEVYVFADKLTCSYQRDGRWIDGQCNGLQQGSALLITRRECGYATAYAHELAHWLQQCCGSAYDPDYAHAEPGLWTWVDGAPFKC